MLRHRSNTEYSEGVGVSSYISAQYYTVDGEVIWYWPSWPVLYPYPIVYPSRFEEMYDDPDNAYRGVKQLVHTSVRRKVTGNTYLDFPDAVVGGTSIWGRQTALNHLAGQSLTTSMPPVEKPGFGVDMLERCLEKAGQQDPSTQALQMMPFIGELHHTVRMVANPWSFLGELVRRAGRKRKGSLLKVLSEHGVDASSGGWLSYQYGWNPLIRDLNAIMSSLGSLNDQYALYKANRAKTPRQIKVSITDHAQSFRPRESPAVAEFSSSQEASHKARCILWGQVEPSGDTLTKFEFLRRKWGLCPSSAISAAWELVPYSFIVDWFIPVGGYLKAITGTPLNFRIVQQQYDLTTTGTTLFSFASNRNPLAAGPEWRFHNLGSDHFRQYTRQTMPFVSPVDKSWFSSTRALSALALIAQKLLLPISRRV